MITGVNHITLSVSNLNQSWDFYTLVLGATPLCRWHKGAYLELGNVWLCLNLQSSTKPAEDYTHIAWDIDADHFNLLHDKIIASGVEIFQENSSEGVSLYFCDPDGHKLELHVGNWQSRIAHKKLDHGSWQNIEFFV